MAKGYVRTVVSLTGNKKIPLYAGKRVSDALSEVSADMNLYHGVRLSQVLEAVYEQGKKDGARGVFDTVGSEKDDSSSQPRPTEEAKTKRLKAASNAVFIVLNYTAAKPLCNESLAGPVPRGV